MYDSNDMQTEIEDMIWEVDDDCDMCVNWPEFQTMYNRCRQDKTGKTPTFGRVLDLILLLITYAGYEPRRLFNVVEFLMNDKDDSGTVSIEEVMQILYLRFGKGLLDSVSPELELYSWFDKLITFYDSHLVTPAAFFLRLYFLT